MFKKMNANLIMSIREILILLAFVFIVLSSIQSHAETHVLTDLLNTDEDRKIKALSSRILKSRVARSLQMKQQLELDRIQLQEYQNELTGHKKPKAKNPLDEIFPNRLDKDPPDEQGWVVITDPFAAPVFNQKLEARKNRIKKLPGRFSEFAADIKQKISTQAQSQEIDVIRDTKNKKILSLLKSVETELRNDIKNGVIKHERIKELHKRFEIRNISEKRKKELIHNAKPLQPTIQLNLKYSVEEFEAMK